MLQTYDRYYSMHIVYSVENSTYYWPLQEWPSKCLVRNRAALSVGTRSLLVFSLAINVNDARINLIASRSGR